MASPDVLPATATATPTPMDEGMTPSGAADEGGFPEAEAEPAVAAAAKAADSAAAAAAAADAPPNFSEAERKQEEDMWRNISESVVRRDPDSGDVIGFAPDAKPILQKLTSSTEARRFYSTQVYPLAVLPVHVAVPPKMYMPLWISDRDPAFAGGGKVAPDDACDHVNSAKMLSRALMLSGVVALALNREDTVSTKAYRTAIDTVLLPMLAGHPALAPIRNAARLRAEIFHRCKTEAPNADASASDGAGAGSATNPMPSPPPRSQEKKSAKKMKKDARAKRKRGDDDDDDDEMQGRPSEDAGPVDGDLVEASIEAMVAAGAMEDTYAGCPACHPESTAWCLDGGEAPPTLGNSYDMEGEDVDRCVCPDGGGVLWDEASTLHGHTPCGFVSSAPVTQDHVMHIIVVAEDVMWQFSYAMAHAILTELTDPAGIAFPAEWILDIATGAGTPDRTPVGRSQRYVEDDCTTWQTNLHKIRYEEIFAATPGAREAAEEAEEAQKRTRKRARSIKLATARITAAKEGWVCPSRSKAHCVTTFLVDFLADVFATNGDFV